MQTIVVRAIVVDIKARTGHKNAGPKQSNLCCCDKKSRSSAAPPEAKTVNREPEHTRPNPRACNHFVLNPARLALIFYCYYPVYFMFMNKHTHTCTHICVCVCLCVCCYGVRISCGSKMKANASAFGISFFLLWFNWNFTASVKNWERNDIAKERVMKASRKGGGGTSNNGGWGRKNSKGSHCVDSNHMLPALRCHTRALYIYPTEEALREVVWVKDWNFI